MRRSVSGRQEQEKTNNPEAFWDSPGGWPFIVKVWLRSKCGEAELFGLLLKKAKPDIDVRVLRVRLSGFFCYNIPVSKE